MRVRRDGGAVMLFYLVRFHTRRAEEIVFRCTYSSGGILLQKGTGVKARRETSTAKPYNV